MKRTILALTWRSLLLIGIQACITSQVLHAQIDGKSPVFVYVGTPTAKVSTKPLGQSEWNEIQKVGRLFPGDSLRIPERVTVLLGDGSSAWQELAGPQSIAIIEERNRRNKFGRYIDYLYAKFFVERHGRSVSKAGVRSLEGFILPMPDTTVVYSMPESLRWIKSAPWWTAYQVRITHRQKAVLDTVVTSNVISLDNKFRLRQQPGSYMVKVILPQGALLETEKDSCVIHLLPVRQSALLKSKVDELKNLSEKTGRREDYLALVDFCLYEKLYVNMEDDLIRMIKKFPQDHETQAMLYAYYTSFMPEEVAERYLVNRLKELR